MTGQLQQTITKALDKYSCIQAAYLFGSRVRGREKKKSDLDLAVVSTQNISGWERIEMETDLSNQIGVDVDLVIFHQANPLLQHQILKHGRLIMEKSRPERIRQETWARYEYLDTRHLHKELGDLMYKMIVEGLL